MTEQLITAMLCGQNKIVLGSVTWHLPKLQECKFDKRVLEAETNAEELLKIFNQ